MAGDDIIVFDTTRSPVLRALGNYLSRKEKVPAEAVLAYIEAKHTLSIHGEGGQSLQKATEQTAAVKALPRVPLEHRHMVPALSPFQASEILGTPPFGVVAQAGWMGHG
jgi:hypothetical protein